MRLALAGSSLQQSQSSFAVLAASCLVGEVVCDDQRKGVDDGRLGSRDRLDGTGRGFPTGTAATACLTGTSTGFDFLLFFSPSGFRTFFSERKF